VPLILLLILIGLPIAELLLLIEVGGRIGAIYTVGLVILTAAAGISLVRWQGLSAMARAQASLDENRLPVGEAVDGVFLLIAGGFLLFPGFITDAAGLLLLIPIVRRGLGVAIWRALAAGGTVRWRAGGPGSPGGPSGQRDGVIDGEFEDVTDGPKKSDGAPAQLAKPGSEKGKSKKPKGKQA